MFNLLQKIKQFLNLTYYTSQLDQFLSAFDKSHPRLSPSQREEKDKHDRVFKLRDVAAKPNQQKRFWSKF